MILLSIEIYGEMSCDFIVLKMNNSRFSYKQIATFPVKVQFDHSFLYMGRRQYQGYVHGYVFFQQLWLELVFGDDGIDDGSSFILVL